MNSEEWPKITRVQIRVPEFGARLARSKWSVLAGEWPKAAARQGWYCQASGFLFHAYEVCICKLLKITPAAECPIVREILNRTCDFINSQRTTTDENYLDKAYLELNSTRKMCEKFLGFVCSQCQNKLCFLIINKDFNCSDKSYILQNEQ